MGVDVRRFRSNEETTETVSGTNSVAVAVVAQAQVYLARRKSHEIPRQIRDASGPSRDKVPGTTPAANFVMANPVFPAFSLPEIALVLRFLGTPISIPDSLGLKRNPFSGAEGVIHRLGTLK
jgi:hypothetical protein